MAISPGEYAIGPEHDTLRLRTGRQGLAAQVGHDLTIEVTRWSGRVTVGDTPADSSVQVTVDTGSLRVVEGVGGVTPLSEKDKGEIARNARKILNADRQPEATFRADTLDSTTALTGTLTILGRTNSLELRITELGDSRFSAAGRVNQSDYGIKPYTALFGALKLADAIEVIAEVNLITTKD